MIQASDVPEAQARRDDWGHRLGSYVLAIGGIEPRKGTIDLIEAYHVLREHFPDVGLVIAGGETLFDYRDYRAAFEDRCDELDVEPVTGDLPVLREALEVGAPVARGRALATSLTWDESARRHVEFHETHPMPG